jgi:hypothetical protein
VKLASVLNLGDIAPPDPVALAICVALAMLTILIASRAA